MDKELLRSEINNLKDFFDDEIRERQEIKYAHVSDVICDSLREDMWTSLLNVYLSNDQKNMAVYFGKLSQLNWPEEEKVLWKILLLSRCLGSDAEMKKLIVHMNNLEKYSYAEELLISATNIFIGREQRSREKKRSKELDSLQKSIDASEARMLKAKNDILNHRM